MRKIWDLLGFLVSLIFSLILWFEFFGTSPFTILSVVNAAVVWIVGIIIIGFGAKIIGWILEVFDAELEVELNKIKK